MRSRRKRAPPSTPTSASALTLTLTLTLAMMHHLPRGASAQHLFPYVPTQILMPPPCWDESASSSCVGGANTDVAYVFSQTDSGTVEFSALNFSGTLGQDTSPLGVLTSELPFLPAGEPATTAFAAARTGDGSVVVYAGACDGSAAGGGSVWSYAVAGGSGGADAGSRTWTRRRITTARGPARGPYFLGGTVAFSSRLAPTLDEPTVYTYGGMCAAGAAAAGTDWRSAADYTTTIVSLSPQANTSADAAYALSVASTGGPRTPIAGFTFTQLAPSATNISGTVTQQAGFVLLGGHTQQAFINMSTAAVWKLPEMSWSYIDIKGPAGGNAMAGTELASRDGGPDHDHDDASTSLQRRASADGGVAARVESRSGHTAVLTEDGTAVVVYGGWVGNVSTPAEPQLVVLRLGQAYSSWTWTVPRAQPDGPGVYGHGAAMLPGNVMVVYGGWETTASASASSSSRRRRQTAGGGGGGVVGRRTPRFFNATSLSWSTSYANPRASRPGRGGTDAPADAALDGSGVGKSRHLGLGLGLGLGLALGLAVGLLAALCLWRARERRRRRAREEAARSMARDAQCFVHETGEMVEERGGDDGPFLCFSAASAATLARAGSRGSAPRGYESLRGATGASEPPDDGQGHGHPPAVVNGRKGGLSRAMLRGGYVPAETRLNPFVSQPGRIHPIMEDDEEDLVHEERQQNQSQNNGEPSPLTPTSEVHSDPFLTPTAGATTTNVPAIAFPPTAKTSYAPTMNAASSTGGGGGGGAPHHHRYYDTDVQDWVTDVDAADSLLEQYASSRKGRATPVRRTSSRSTALRDDESRSGSNLSETNRSAIESLRRSPSAATTRRQTVSGLFLGGMLLGGGPAVDQPPRSGPGSSSSSSHNTSRSGLVVALQAEAPGLPGGGANPPHQNQADEDEDASSPPSPSKSKPRRGWLGSLGRVFSQPSSGSLPVVSAEQRRILARDYAETMDLATADYEPARGGLHGELLRRKQGRRDWEVDGADGGRGRGEVEWDIERAVEQRLVQVMFTVPKERLRVVNGGGKEEEEDEDEDKMTSGGGADADADADAGGPFADRPAEQHAGDPPPRRAWRSSTRSVNASAAEEEGSVSSGGRAGAADEVRRQRRMGRVLQMVESIESLNGQRERERKDS